MRSYHCATLHALSRLACFLVWQFGMHRAIQASSAVTFTRVPFVSLLLLGTLCLSCSPRASRYSCFNMRREDAADRAGFISACANDVNNWTLISLESLRLLVQDQELPCSAKVVLFYLFGYTNRVNSMATCYKVVLLMR